MRAACSKTAISCFFASSWVDALSNSFKCLLARLLVEGALESDIPQRCASCDTVRAVVAVLSLPLQRLGATRAKVSCQATSRRG
eukprot:3839702-Amphidinium_carterae.1